MSNRPDIQMLDRHKVYSLPEPNLFWEFGAEVNPGNSLFSNPKLFNPRSRARLGKDFLGTNRD